MKFYSTNNKNNTVSLKQAVIEGLASDHGLYMPATIRTLPREFIASLGSRTFKEIAQAITENIFDDELPADEIKKLIDQTIQFDAPLVEIGEGIFSLELFHGPTLAFKDFGARFMSYLLGYFAREAKKEIIVLVATSGDTGSAVANGFLQVQGTRVVILYPAGGVSDIQEKQFTTLGNNITAVEVTGTFDDCQRLVKQAFHDEDLKKELFLTSANSINIARLIPQSFYYFHAVAQLRAKNITKPVVFSVPSGNFGNLTAGLMAKRMGLPVEKFIISTNANDVVPAFLETNIFTARRSVQTISNAMDVGNPSNFARMIDLYGYDIGKIKMDMRGYSFSDEETRHAMREVFASSRYMLDPHGAVAYSGLKKYFEDRSLNAVGIFLETAHPAKFHETVKETLTRDIEIPPALSHFLQGQKKTTRVPNEFGRVKELLLDL